MVQLKKSADITLYANLICEFLFEDEAEKDGMNHSALFDLKDIPHRMTVLELKEKFSPMINCPAW